MHLNFRMYFCPAPPEFGTKSMSRRCCNVFSFQGLRRESTEWLWFWVGVALVGVCGLTETEGRCADRYEKELRPFLKKHCVGCHGPQQQKAELRLDQLDPDMVNGSDTDTWQEVLDLVNLDEMPPAAAKLQPASADRQRFVDALTAALREAMEVTRSSGGSNTLRRLTAYEYNNTLRDLLHLDLRYAVDLPPEGVAKEGFKNNTTVLMTSALHLEYFERIARGALSRILLAPQDKPAPYFVRVEPELAFAGAADKKNEANKNRRKKPGSGVSYGIKNGDHYAPGNGARGPLFRMDFGEAAGDSILLAGNRPRDPVNALFEVDRKIGGSKGDGRSGFQPEFRIEMYEVPYDAPVRVRIRCAAVPGKGGSWPRLSFELGSFRGANVSDQKEAVNVEVRSSELQTLEFVVHGANFPFQSNKPGRPSYFRIYNDYRRGTSQLTYEELPKLKIDWVELQGNYYETWPSPAKQSILFASEYAQDEPRYAREVIARFMQRAYRRPVLEVEVERKLALFRKLRPQEESFEATMVATLTAVLCSPHFLLLSEPGDAGADAEAATRRRLDDYELASRLSYFLWSSMPDTTLFELAEAGRLHEPDVLREQVRRMIGDPKSAGFARHFTSQWLDLPAIRRLAVNPEYFDFQEPTKDLFEEESIRFVHHVLREDLDIANFIDSKFVVLNHALAKHYRIPGISGGFQVRELPAEQHRGGLLTQASMLFGNSTGAETHPIKRGVWVLERLLDDPPPPPPPNVPELVEPEGPDESKLSLKERLVAHAQVASCRDCHRKIDPWGVVFENYNALGQWREGTRDPLVRPPHQEVNSDPETQLRNGRSLRNLDELKAYLLTEKKTQFRRAVVRKVLAYALGRYLDFSDRKSIDLICEAVESRDDTFQSVLEEVVLSEQFLTK